MTTPRLRALWLLTLAVFALTPLHAGTTGKIAGRITDQHREALPAAIVQIPGTQLGASADLDGYYSIINVPPGRYRVQFSLVGYRPLTVQDIVVSVNATTRLDATLEESVITQEAVVVTAQRPVVNVNLTSSVASLGTAEIAALPVQELQDVVDLQAGVVNGHFRGGRIGEVQYQVNGVSVNNAYDNSSTLRIDRSLIQEVQVISGTFDAEYGQAMSGVVNAVLKSGSEDFRWNAEVYGGDWLYPGDSRRGITYKSRPGSIRSYQVNMSGPTGLPQTTFILSGRRSEKNDYLYGTRRFRPTDRSDFEAKVLHPTGDNAEVALGLNNEWSGLAKITNRSLPAIEIAYQAIANQIDQKNANWDYRLNPDGIPLSRTFSIVHGLDWTQTLSSATFYTVSVRQNLYYNRSHVYRSVYDPRYLEAGTPEGDYQYELGAIIQGVDLGRFLQRTNTLVVKSSVTSQASHDHQLKAGVEYQLSKVEFGTPGHLVQTNINGVQTLAPRVNDPPDYPDPKTYHPLALSAFGQDQIEWNDLTLRAGVRMDYFNARATLPSDLANPANAIAGAPHSVPRAATAKTSVSPRLGVSYPISTSAALFFSYGHFYQFPGLGTIFGNSDYTILKDLQAGIVRYGVMGNPDIKPERTIQYEFGYKQAVNDLIGVNFSIFYKDIRDLLGVEFVSTYTAAEYARLTNVDFGNVYGFTLSLDQRRIGNVTTSVDYTWQQAQGNSSDPRETATRAEAGEDPRPRQVPLNWDQRHTLNVTVQYGIPDNFSVSTVVRFGSGQPYTPSTASGGFGAQLEPNSAQKSSFVLVDLRGEKSFRFGGLALSLFARVFNLFDSRFSNGFVFSDTGSPDYSLNPVGDRSKLADPLRYYQPRRVEIGVSINNGL